MSDTPLKYVAANSYPCVCPHGSNFITDKTMFDLFELKESVNISPPNIQSAFVQSFTR